MQVLRHGREEVPLQNDTARVHTIYSNVKAARLAADQKLRVPI
jgi:hypothetical protein